MRARYSTKIQPELMSDFLAEIIRNRDETGLHHK
jgi:hypothetical protein